MTSKTNEVIVEQLHSESRLFMNCAVVGVHAKFSALREQWFS